MKKKIYALFLIIVMLFSLSACARSPLAVSDVNVSKKGNVSVSVTPYKDMEDVTIRVTATGSDDKVNFKGKLPASEDLKKKEETEISFNVFDSELWADAKISYNIFENMYESFLDDDVTCELIYDGETIASFEIDTSDIDLEKAMKNILKDEEENAASSEDQEASSSPQDEDTYEDPDEDPDEDPEEKDTDDSFAASPADDLYALELIGNAGIGDFVSDSDNLMGIYLEDIHFDDDGDVYVRWDFTNDLMNNNRPYAYTQIRFFDPKDLSDPYAPFVINDDNTFSVTFKDGDEMGTYDFMHLDHEKFDPDSGVIFMYFNGSGEGAPEELNTAPLVFTINTNGGTPHAVEDMPRYAPEEMIKAFSES